ncbi:MAG: VapC toxin family PIN domain ribonuclease [Armatimonadota bacterium]
MKYLLDSSILLEGLLLQARAQEVHDLLSRAEAGELCLTDFSLHSIALILTRHGFHALLVQFVEDMVLSGFLTLIALSPSDLAQVVQNQLQYRLDFDDAISTRQQSGISWRL